MLDRSPEDIRNFLFHCVPSVNPDATPGVPYMFYFPDNKTMFSSDVQFYITPHVLAPARSIVVDTALWIVYKTSTTQYGCALDAMSDAAAFPFRPFVKGESTKIKKRNANGKTPRLIINTTTANVLASYVVYNDVGLNAKRPIGESPITLGYGVARDTVKSVVHCFESRRKNKYPAVSNDIGGWEQGFSFQLMLIACRIYHACFTNNVGTSGVLLWRFLSNYALLCADCVYVMPNGQLVQKLVASLMPSGILFTAIFNSLARFFLSRVMGCFGIFMGDDACEYTSDPARAAAIAVDVGLNIKVDEQIVLTEPVDDEFRLIDGLHFCSAVLYANGDHVPSDSSLMKSVLSALTGLKKATFQEIVEANTLRCNTQQGYDNLIRTALHIQRLYQANGGSLDFDPDKVRNFGDVSSLGLTGRIVY